MAGKQQIKDEVYERIITDRLVLGKKVETIAEEVGFGTTSVWNAIKVFNAVRDCDWNVCIALIENQNFSIAPFTWAAKRLGIELPEAVTDAYEAHLKNRAEERLKEKEQKQKEEEAEAVKAVQSDNSALYFIKILEALNKQNELLEQLLDTVIPHWANDLKDNVNANVDTLVDRLNEEIRISECIKQNTRKRGL